MKRPCRYHPTQEQLAKLQAARAEWHADPAHQVQRRVTARAAARRKSRGGDGKFTPSTDGK